MWLSLLARLGIWLIRRLPEDLLSPRTRALVDHDLRRARARARQGSNRTPAVPRLHLGCGSRRVPGWLNADLERSEHDLDVAGGRLPWRDAVFTDVVAEHLVEHLELGTELVPLLRELRRVVRPGGELWLSTPDLARICRAYVEDGAVSLLRDRRARWARFDLGAGVPASQLVNHLFHQDGEHRNLLDEALLGWALTEAGLPTWTRVDEAALLARYPGFPARGDDAQTLYVRVIRPS